MAFLTPLAASRSKVHCSKGLFIIGKRALGLVHVSGLSLVPNPPMRIKAFSWLHTFWVVSLVFAVFRI
jgi:hypothetical protein